VWAPSAWIVRASVVHTEGGTTANAGRPPPGTAGRGAPVRPPAVCTNRTLVAVTSGVARSSGWLTPLNTIPRGPSLTFVSLTYPRPV
jgi:hypothetical protein